MGSLKQKQIPVHQIMSNWATETKIAATPDKQSVRTSRAAEVSSADVSFQFQKIVLTEMDNFYNDTKQAWESIFKLCDRVRRLEKLDKTQGILNIFFFLMICGLIVSNVMLYDLLTR